LVFHQGEPYRFRTTLQQQELWCVPQSMLIAKPPPQVSSHQLPIQLNLG
jgi:hypothetical protein